MPDFNGEMLEMLKEIYSEMERGITSEAAYTEDYFPEPSARMKKIKSIIDRAEK